MTALKHQCKDCKYLTTLKNPAGELGDLCVYYENKRKAPYWAIHNLHYVYKDVFLVCPTFELRSLKPGILE